MTNLPRGTDVISRAASHHTEQNRTQAGGRAEKQEEGKPILAKVVIRQLLKKLGRADADGRTARGGGNGQPTATDIARHTRCVGRKLENGSCCSRGCPISPVLPPFVRPPQSNWDRAGERRGEERSCRAVTVN